MTDTYTRTPGKVRITPGYLDNNTRYKEWDRLDNLKTNTGTAYCRHPDYQYPTIAGKNGTYKQPAPLDLTEYGYSLASDIKVDSITVSYTVQTFINEGYWPSFQLPTVTLLNTNLASQTQNGKITGTKTTYTHTWNNVPVSALNSPQFGVRFWFDQNRETTPSRIELSNVKVTVNTTDYSTKTDLNIDAPQKLTMGISHEVTCKIQKTSQLAYNTTLQVTLPFGVTIDGAPTRVDGTITSNGTQSYEGNTYNYINWQVQLPAGSSNALLKFKIKAIRPSNTYTCTNKKRITQFRIYDPTQKNEYSTIVNVTQIEAVVQSDFNKENISLRALQAYKYNLKMYSNDPMLYTKTLHLKYQDGMDVIINLSEIQALGTVQSATYHSASGEYRIVFKQQRLINQDIPIQVIYESAGEYDFRAWVTINSTDETVSNIFDKPCVVLGTNYQKLGFTRMLIDDYTDQMGHGVEYTLGCMVRAVMIERTYALMEFGNNYRIGVYNGGATDVDDDEDFAENVIWAEKQATKTLTEQTVKFTYNSEEPLYMVWSHTYTADATGPYVTMNFSEPILAESSIYDEVMDNTGVSLKPVVNTILNADYATATMTASMSQLNKVAIDQWEDGGLLSRDISILGMELTFDYEVSEDCSVEAQLFVNGTLSGSRDIFLYKGKGTGTVGSIYDLFGLSPSDLINRDEECINPFEIHFYVSNPYMNANTVKVRNCVITIEYIKRSSCQYGFTIDGEYSKDYGIILNEVTHNRGTKNDKSLYHVEGTDETIVNRLNVDTKDIKLSISLGNSCDYEDLRHIIDRIVELFTNDRYLHSNKPIPKKLVFDHMPDRYYDVVRVEDFDDEFNTQMYKADIKLLVPAGTTYDLEETVTGKHGYSPSSVTVRPHITYVSNTAGIATIFEEEGMQSFTIQDTRITNGATITIACEERRVCIGNTDITEGVNYNSIWFRLRGEYNFSSDTGNVVKVEYRVRRG